MFRRTRGVCSALALRVEEISTSLLCTQCLYVHAGVGVDRGGALPLADLQARRVIFPVPCGAAQHVSVSETMRP